MALSATMEDAGDVASASHVLVVLTGDTLQPGTQCLPELEDAVRIGCPMLYVYSEEHGWDFGGFFSGPESAAKDAIGSHEAMVYRPKDARSATGGYQFEAMALELIRKMRT